jgi:hypothetical protein
MKLRQAVGIVLGLTVGVALGLASAQTAQASQKYTVVSEKWPTQRPTYRAKYPNKKVAMWNKKHTKRHVYLADRPNTTFSRASTVVLKHGQTKAVYYYLVAGGTKAHPKATAGYVWRGYVTQGLALDRLKSRYVPMGWFTNNRDYQDYLKLSPTQGITRAIAKSLPNMKLTYDLTNIAAYEFGQKLGNEDPALPMVKKSVLKTNKYQHVTYFPKVTEYLATSNAVSTTKRVKKVKQILANDYGYTTAKLGKLRHYEIGLNNEENVKGKPSIDNGPNAEKFYAFAIGQRVN